MTDKERKQPFLPNKLSGYFRYQRKTINRSTLKSSLKNRLTVSISRTYILHRKSPFSQQISEKPILSLILTRVFYSFSAGHGKGKMYIYPELLYFFAENRIKRIFLQIECA